MMQNTKNEKVVKLMNTVCSLIQSFEMYKIKREEHIITTESNRLKKATSDVLRAL